MLVWDMSDPAPYAGQGYTYCDLACRYDGSVYATVCSDAQSNPDTLGVFGSYDGGSSWEEILTGTAGPWSLIDPEMVLTPDYALVFMVKKPPYPGRGRPSVARIDLEIGQWVDSYNLGWIETAEADTCVSVSVAYDPASGEVWAFLDDYVQGQPSQLFLTKSSDQGVTWSPLEAVAENVVRHSADFGPGSVCYVTYQSTTTGLINSICFHPSGRYDAEGDKGAYTCAPIVAAEWSGSLDAGIAYEDGEGNVRVAVSSDSGQTWQPGFLVGEGRYPFLDVRQGSSLAALGFRDRSTGRPAVATAPSLSDLQGSSPQVVGDNVVWLGAIPVVRQGELLDDAGLLYLGNGLSDLYFDCTANPQGTPGGGPVPDVTASLRVTPNPFADATRLSYDCPGPLGAGPVLRIYDLRGALVTSLEGTGTGTTTGWVTWQPGETAPAGIYFAVLESSSGPALASVRLIRL